MHVQSRRKHLRTLAKILGLDVKMPEEDEIGKVSLYVFSKEDSPDVNNVCLGLVAAEQWLRGYKFCIASDGCDAFNTGPYADNKDEIEQWKANITDLGSSGLSQIDPNESSL